MLYEKSSTKTMEEIGSALRESAAAHKFGVLHVHDLQQKMREKGVEMERQVCVFEVCNPAQAKIVVEANPAISNALPCRIAVYEKDGRLVVSTMLPTMLIGMFGTEELQPVAAEVEAVLKAMVDAAA
ncbi:MAG: DUF302 domain-containing protein [Acidobacteria bacterium]|nr:DUF302 domain-containing protein [Acidobacteriota bacterium]